MFGVITHRAMTKSQKIFIGVFLLWCVCSPFLWLNSVGEMSQIPLAELSKGLIPHLALALSCIIGIFLILVKETFVPYFLISGAAIALLLFVTLGGLARDGLFVNSAVLVIVGTGLLMRGRKNEL